MRDLKSIEVFLFARSIVFAMPQMVHETAMSCIDAGNSIAHESNHEI